MIGLVLVGGALLAWLGIRGTLVALWPRTGFTTADEVVTHYYQAYPHETVERYLAGQVERIATTAGRP